MSQVLIQQYLNQLQDLRKVSGSSRESVVREAFKDLLKGWARSHDLVFVPEYEIETKTKDRRYVDGALLHALRMPFGYWEAKDDKDDLDAEIEFKFRRGYPQDNIIFEDSKEAVLIQNRQEVVRCAVDDVTALEKLLGLFFRYERAEIAEFRKAVEQFKTDLPAVLKALREMIEGALAGNTKFRKEAQRFLKHAQEAINPSLTDADVREMLIQHVLTEEIFSKVFGEDDFHRRNNVAKELYALEETFFTGDLKKRTLRGLDPYYAAIHSAAAQIGSHHEKQTFLKVIYENFYKVYNVKAADRLGVVYTPNKIVRFMVESADWLCEKHFGRNLIDHDVEILDPAAGTGTFICEMLEYFRGQPAKMKRKYEEELHANEVAILPYYVANLNIEATYAAITGEYLEYQNLCFVDTLDNVGLHTAQRGTTADLFGGVSEENVARIKRQNSRKISVIIGNPPYNANQLNENDKNKNREYPEVDKRIKDTYVAASTAQKTKLYDMYARFFRWASDRLDHNGVLAFITNGSFIDKKTFDGFRRAISKEFEAAYIVDIGGEMRDGDAHGNVFGITVGVAISFWVKKGPQPRKAKPKPAKIHYFQLPRTLDAAARIEFLSRPFSALEFDLIDDPESGEWIKVGNADFGDQIPIGSKQSKANKRQSSSHSIFSTYSLGLSTNRDEWVYSEEEKSLKRKAHFLINAFDAERENPKGFSTEIKWSRNLKRRLQQGRHESPDSITIREVQYRPFVRRFVFDSHLFIDERGRLDSFFFTEPDTAKPRTATKVLIVSDPTSQKETMILAVGLIYDLHLVGAASGAVGFPLALRTENDEDVSNVTDWGLDQFKKHYQPGRAKPKRPITKEAIFHYVYGVLHDPEYRQKYALNLKREFPRIPFYADFWQWGNWGKELMELHIGYESVEPFKLQRIEAGPSPQPSPRKRGEGASERADAPKAMLKADKESGHIVLDTQTTLSGVPPEAWDYKPGNRSALEWILDQYKEKKLKDPTIREKFDTYHFVDYKEKVIDLLMRVTRVSIVTQKIVTAMKAATH
jgi:predicted helicase